LAVAAVKAGEGMFRPPDKEDLAEDAFSLSALFFIIKIAPLPATAKIRISVNR
jgi:hypothetical protein